MAGNLTSSGNRSNMMDDILNYDFRADSNFTENFANQPKTSIDAALQNNSGATREGANIDLLDHKASSENAKRDRRASLAQESATQTMFRLSNEFMPLIEEGADTLVYLGIPPRLPNQSHYEFNFIEQQFQRPYLMRSETLKKVGPSKFNDFLGPMSARVERRLKKLGIHKQVQRLENIKYYIDLSPAIDGDEALDQVAQLTVPSGALNWHLKAEKFGVPIESVCGRDSLDIPPKPIFNLRTALEPTSDEEEANQGKKVELTDDGTTATKSPGKANKKKEQPDHSLYGLPVEDEHSSLRHCTSTARLLHAIAGNDPKLNSAAKAWAFCMLANIYGCAQAPQVSTHITSWLLQSGNMNFIQTNPDVAYRMAIATQSIWLMRCAFAILVGQQAMIETTNDYYSAFQPDMRKTKHVATCLDDDDINRIDHAASNLSRRVRTVLEEIAVFPGVWSLGAMDCFEMGKLERLRFDDEERQALLKKTKEYFKHYIRRIIYMTMSDSFPNDNSNVDPYIPNQQFLTFRAIPRPVRLLTQHFWDVLRKEEYSRDYLDTTNNHLIWETTQEILRREGILREPSIPYVSKSQVVEAVEELNRSRWWNAKSPEQSKPKIVRFESDRRPATPEAASPTKKVKLSPIAISAPFAKAAEMGADSGTSTPTESGTRTPVMVDAEPIDLLHDDESDWSEDSWEKTNVQLTDAQYSLVDDEWEDALNDSDVPAKRTFRPLEIRNKTDLDIMEGSSSLSAVETSKTFSVGTAVSSEQSSLTSQPRDTALNAETFDTIFDSSTTNQHKSVLPPAASLPFRIPAQGVTRSPYAVDEGVPATNFNLKHSVSGYDKPAHSNTQSSHTNPSPHSAYSKPRRIASRGGSSAAVQESNNFTDNRHDVHDDASGLVNARVEAESKFMANYLPSKSALVPPQLSTENLIMPVTLLGEIGIHMHRRLHTILQPGYITDQTCDFDVPTSTINTLLCLGEDEYKYLPLWAYGLDDGSGGVFNDGMEVPDAPDVNEGGFRGGAMGIIPGVGSSIGGSVVGSEFEDLGTEAGVSTVGKASRYATDGTATETVISMDE